MQSHLRSASPSRKADQRSARAAKRDAAETTHQRDSCLIEVPSGRDSRIGHSTSTPALAPLRRIASAALTAIGNWIRALPERHGKTTLILLALILVLGFGLRAYRVVEPSPTPGDDAHAYYALSKSLYEEGSYGGPDLPRRQRLVAGGAAALRRRLLRHRRSRAKARRGSSRRCSAWRRSSSSSCSGGGSTAGRPGCSPRSAVAIYPPFIHSTGELYERAAGDLHPAGRGPRLPLGRARQERLRAWLPARASSSA